MGLFDSPPSKTLYTLKEGINNHLAVYALQRSLRSINDSPVANDPQYPEFTLKADGDFGPNTERAVKKYQELVNLTKDGIAGPITQARLSRSLVLRSVLHHDALTVFPRALIEGIIAGESNSLLGAVNWSVSGGVDCGYTQRRVYGPPYDPNYVRRAFDAPYQVNLLVDQIIDRYNTYYNYSYVSSRKDRKEYAIRLAVLHHNYPYGAHRLASGYALSRTKKASWVPVGVTFEDGASVYSYMDWCEFYSMGSITHRHRGMMVKRVLGIPKYPNP